MKNLFLFLMALVMTSSIAFAATQSNTPYAKGKYYGEKIVQLGLEGDEEAINKLSTSCENYIDANIETEEQIVKFIEGFEAGIRKACNDYGLGEEAADMLMEEFAKALLSELGL